MTWPEICDELVRRWPQHFDFFEHSQDLAITTSSGDALLMSGDTVDGINLICSIIGAVVWSAPSWVEGRHDGWYGAHEENDNVVFTVGIYPTRAEAELAALGAWLEATR